MTKIKFCGLRREADIEYANELKPDYIGFVFAPKSKRYVDAERAKRLKAFLDPEIKAVGVFVNADIDLVSSLLNDKVIDIAQLHGDEDISYIRRLKEQSGLQTIKAFKMDGKTDLEAIENSPADFVLLDSGSGSGITFDWSLINGVKRPYFLAGGLTPQNVGEAIRRLNPYALDVSGGIETDGFKDKEKMLSFMKAAEAFGKDEDR